MVYVPYVNEALGATANTVKYLLSSGKSKPPAPVEIVTVENLNCGMLVRLAGLSGAVAVLCGAYGSHGFGAEREKEKRIFQTGAYYHLIHSVALLGAAQAGRPYLTASLFLVGMTMFCGSCYYVALTGDQRISKIAPVGGITLVVAWLSLAL
ncbi:Transmembrane protein [Fasciola hepatica]|uniref:Transmembrane protein n=1 Tax=Fasciola hepatica TaxID=6192 RepID=A0A2H1BY04_FASHE|nr:Transmembrane protein [Fasciola hepatica]